jgi:hypothetical protein
MTVRLQITCITKPDRYNPNERIQAVGGPGFYYDLDGAIALVESGQVEFFVNRGGWQVDVVVRRPGGLLGYHRPYLATKPDGTPIDNLLSLDQCGLNGGVRRPGMIGSTV